LFEGPSSREERAERAEERALVDGSMRQSQRREEGEDSGGARRESHCFCISLGPFLAASCSPDQTEYGDQSDRR